MKRSHNVHSEPQLGAAYDILLAYSLYQSLTLCGWASTNQPSFLLLFMASIYLHLLMSTVVMVAVYQGMRVPAPKSTASIRLINLGVMALWLFFGLILYRGAHPINALLVVLAFSYGRGVTAYAHSKSY